MTDSAFAGSGFANFPRFSLMTGYSGAPYIQNRSLVTLEYFKYKVTMLLINTFTKRKVD